MVAFLFEVEQSDCKTACREGSVKANLPNNIVLLV